MTADPAPHIARPTMTAGSILAVASTPAPKVKTMPAAMMVLRSPNQSPALPATNTTSRAEIAGTTSASSTVTFARSRSSAIGWTRNVSPVTTSKVSPTMTEMARVMRRCAGVIGSLRFVSRPQYGRLRRPGGVKCGGGDQTSSFR